MPQKKHGRQSKLKSLNPFVIFFQAIFETPSETHSENSFFGIYDGHRNSYVSDFLQRNLHKMLLNHQDLEDQPEKAFKESSSPF